VEIIQTIELYFLGYILSLAFMNKATRGKWLKLETFKYIGKQYKIVWLGIHIGPFQFGFSIVRVYRQKSIF
jgi:hypothetical protein